MKEKLINSKKILLGSGWAYRLFKSLTSLKIWAKAPLGVWAFCLLLTSCHKDINGVGPGVNGANGNVMVAYINGQVWGAESGYVRYIQPHGLELFGTHGSSNMAVMTISPYNGLQTYPLNGITRITYSENGDDYTSTTGEITVTADNDQYIEGTFHCEMVSNSAGISLSFTNGQFQIPK